jgi:hypothetical protein
MEKLEKYWKLLFGGAILPTIVGYLQGFVSFVQCATEKCIGPERRGIAVIMLAISLGMAGFALWLRGNLEKRKAKSALSALQDTAFLFQHCGIRLREQEVAVFDRYIDDVSVVSAMQRTVATIHAQLGEDASRFLTASNEAPRGILESKKDGYP